MIFGPKSFKKALLSLTLISGLGLQTAYTSTGASDQDLRLNELLQEMGLSSLPKVIYGQDNRYEAADYPESQFREYSQSVAGMVQHFRLYQNDQGNYEFPLIRLKDSTLICEDESFVEQYTLPRCSGLLVGPDLILTAGHCVIDAIDCRNNRWVFGFIEGVTELAEDSVYACSEILEREFIEDRFQVKDYSLIRLDRKVEGRQPLKVRTRGRVRLNTPVLVMGHPSGLPLKIADGAKVRRMNRDEVDQPISTLLKKRDYFNADLDAFGGNSGSPVFNHRTGVVEGILIQGADDYVMDEEDNCLRPNVLRNSRWDAEEMVLRSTRVQNLKEHIKESYRRHGK